MILNIFVFKIFHFDTTFIDFLEDIFPATHSGRGGGVRSDPLPQIISFLPKVDFFRSKSLKI